MKFQIILFLVAICYSCTPNPHNAALASTDSLINAIEADRMKDSLMKRINNQVMFDTVGIQNAPIKVLKARLIEKEYSNYKDISLTFKNVSKKTVEGIKFRWYGETVFGDPADMGMYGSYDGFGSGFMDKRIKPGQTMTLTWDISSRNGKKVVLAWPNEVVFEDGSKWESTNEF